MSQNRSPDAVHQTMVIARAQLDDLMAELEAGARFVERIESGVAALDGRRSHNQQQREEMAQLVLRLGELRASVRQQRMLMKQLRECFDTLRRQTTRRP